MVEAVIYNPVKPEIGGRYRLSRQNPITPSNISKPTLNLVEEVEATAITATRSEVRLRVTKAIVKFGRKEFTCKMHTTLSVRKLPTG